MLDDYTHTGSINDTGGGQTLAALLGGRLNLSQFTNTTFRIGATNKTGSAEGYIASLTVVSNFPPQLEINVSGVAEVQVRWSTNDLDCILETTLTLPAASWQVVTNTKAVVGQQYIVNLDVSEARRYFRLRKN